MNDNYKIILDNEATITTRENNYKLELAKYEERSKRFEADFSAIKEELSKLPTCSIEYDLERMTKDKEYRDKILKQFETKIISSQEEYLKLTEEYKEISNK